MERMEPDPDLDELVRQLNESRDGQSVDREEGEDERAGETASASRDRASSPPVERGRPEWRLPRASAEDRARLTNYLRLAREQRASDLLVTAGQPLALRIDGRLRLVEGTQLGAEEVARLCASLVPDSRRHDLETRGSVDFGLASPDSGRVRGNVHRERRGWAVSLRLLPGRSPSIEALNLPEQVSALGDLRRGLVVVSGPTGSGKSSTLAALLRRVMSRRACHIITIEDPIEYEHGHEGSLVEQIEVGIDAPDFATALRASLRQDPDVLMVGEMRDPESIAMAVTAAETGHLVLSTLHTGGAVQTVSRIVDAHPGEDGALVRAQLASSLEAVVCQQLVPASDGGSRVPVVEVLRGSDAVRNLIRKGQLEQIGAQAGLGSAESMLTFDGSLARLVRSGLVDYEEARRRARHPREFELLLK